MKMESGGDKHWMVPRSLAEQAQGVINAARVNDLSPPLGVKMYGIW